jgi:hypothetical protein
LVVTTRLDKALKREITIRGDLYRVTITPTGLSLVPKGHRKGYELAWIDLVSGDAALATALTASLAGAPKPRSTTVPPKRSAPRAKQKKRRR